MRADRAVLFGLASAAVVAAAGCIQVAGPSFSNLSKEEVRVFATFDVPPGLAVDGMPIQPGETFRDPFDQRLVSLVVQAHGQTFELGPEAVLTAQGSMAKSDQYWVFDGSAICLTTVKGIDAVKRDGCGAAKPSISAKLVASRGELGHER